MSPRIPRSPLLAIVLGIAIAVALACTPTATTPEPAKPAAKEPAKAATTAPATKAPAGPTGRAVIGVSGIHPTLTPTELGAPTRQHLYAVFDNLTMVSIDGEIVPNLAKSWRLLDDTLTWEFELYEGVMFHDGTPANAEAVKWTYDFIANPENQSSLLARVRGVQEVIAVDETTVHFVTETPDPILYKTVESVPIGSPTLYEESNGEAWSRTAAGSGAFKVKSFESGVSVTLEAVTDPMPHHPQPKIAEVEFRSIPEASTRVAALRNGEIDVADGLEVDQGLALQSEGFPIVRNATPQTLALTMNIFESTDPDTPVKNPQVRQAVIRSIDNEEIAEVVFGGLVEPQYQILTPAADGYDPDLRQTGYDLDEALRLMEEAGYPDGFSSQMHVLAQAAPLVALGTAVAGYLDAIGIRVEIEQMTGPRYTELFLQGPMHPFYVSTWTHSNLDGTGALQWFTTETRAPIRYDNPKFDELYRQQAQELDPDKRTQLLQQLSRILIEEDPVQKYIAPTPRFAVTSKRLVDFKLAPAKSRINDMYVTD